MKQSNPLIKLWAFVRTEQAEIKNIYVLAVFQGIVNLSLPLGIQAIINLLQAGQLRSSWIVLVIFVLSGILFYGILQLKQMTMMESIEQRFFVKSAFGLASNLPKISMESSRGKYIPEMMNRFFEVMTVQKGISKLLTDFSTGIIQILFGLILLSFYHPLFILLGVMLLLLLVAVFWISGPSGMKSSIEESGHKFAMAQWLEEISRTLMTFKLAGETSLPLDKTDEHCTAYLKARMRHFRILMIQYKVLIAFKLLVSATLIIAGSFLVVEGLINIGQFVAAEIIILLVINSVEKVMLNMNTVYDVLTALEKIGNILDIPIERQDGIDITTENSTQGLRINVDKIGYRHDDNNVPVFENVSFNLLRGQKLFVSGGNGSGKTTLLKILAGINENFTGSIQFNDIPLSNINLEKLRGLIGENFTEHEIFKSSILDNILCGRPDLTIHDATAAAACVQLNSYIQNLPEGYSTKLDPEGKRLSSGIVKKIILARCIVGKPPLLLIEDNLTNISAEERRAFFNSVFNEFKESTAIIISNDNEIREKCDSEIDLSEAK